jgi:Phosphotransferase enzyme family
VNGPHRDGGPAARQLPGGTVTRVTRRGDVVQRTTGPWSPAVHTLLRHLERAGFDRAPRLVGVDAEGETLTYLEGVVPDPRRWCGADETVRAAGRLLRRFHDAVATFPLDTVTGWDTFLQQPGGGDILCHNDFGPHNCVLVGGVPWGIIDFDGAAPGSRVWDLAVTALGFVPLGSGDRSVDRASRLRLLCDAYGLDRTGRAQLVGLARSRLAVMRARLLERTPPAAGASPHAPSIRYLERSLRQLDRDRPVLEAALSVP